MQESSSGNILGDSVFFIGQHIILTFVLEYVIINHHSVTASTVHEHSCTT